MRADQPRRGRGTADDPGTGGMAGPEAARIAAIIERKTRWESAILGESRRRETQPASAVSFGPRLQKSSSNRLDAVVDEADRPALGTGELGREVDPEALVDGRGDLGGGDGAVLGGVADLVGGSRRRARPGSGRRRRGPSSRPGDGRGRRPD